MEQSLIKLARILAINHYNVSVARGNREGADLTNEDLTPGIKNIIQRPCEQSELGFTRNILIVGAGASKNAYDFFNVTRLVIEKLQENLGLGNESSFLNNKLVLAKYIQEASRIAEYIFEEEDKESIPAKLGFEGYLRLLTTFFTEEHVSSALKTAIRSQEFRNNISDTLPSLFYEVVAHLFKHRYLDVIVNLNFDELLDNAIEDDLGVSTYHSIISDLDCRPFEEIVDTSRLRIPIYIKPQGSFRSRSSMRFTKDHYILLPSEIKDLLQDIFDGKTGASDHRVQRFNIIFAGYGLNDIDMQRLLFQQMYSFLNAEIVRLTYFIFDIDPNFVDAIFLPKFYEWLKRKGIDHYHRALSLESKIREAIDVIAVSSDPRVDELQDQGLGIAFRTLYKKIQEEFMEKMPDSSLRLTPFTPRDLTRHEILIEFFPRNVLSNLFTNNILKTDIYLLRRARFHALYSLVKYKGKIPINVINGDRAGKYLSKFLNLIRKEDNFRPENETSLISYLEDFFLREGLGRTELMNSFFVCKDFYEGKIFNRENKQYDPAFNKIIDAIVDELYVNSYNQSKASAARIKERLLFEVFDSRTSEINAVYNDQKHRKFSPFSQENIISTNLELTWSFFQFATEGDWDTLCIIDDTGKAIYNLFSYSTDRDNNYLKRIVLGNKKIALLNLIPEPRKFLFAEKKNELIIKTIKDVFSVNAKHDNFINCHIDEENNFHKMALFLRFGVPVFGIYYFKPGTKVKINPVRFSHDDDTLPFNKQQYSRKNLQLMKKIFAYYIPSHDRHHQIFNSNFEFR